LRFEGKSANHHGDEQGAEATAIDEPVLGGQWDAASNAAYDAANDAASNAAHGPPDDAASNDDASPNNK